MDSFIAAELTESIVRGTSYDMLEAHHGILPISRRSFYRRRRTAQEVDAAEDGTSGRREERADEDGYGGTISKENWFIYEIN